MRPLEELLDPDEAGWTSFREWANASPRSVHVLPVADARRSECLLRLQVSTRSVLGALAWHTGGVLLDHGWLRLLGGVSSAGLPDVATATGLLPDGSGPPSHLVVALDVVGGRFAVNGGGLPGEPGEVAYYAPDTLSWLPLEQACSGFVSWALTGALPDFYADLRWTGWEAEAAATPADSLLAVYPPLFSREAQQDLGGTSRRAVPWHEVLSWQAEVAAQLSAVPDGGQFELTVEPPPGRRG